MTVERQAADPLAPGALAFIGFGEAAQAFLAGWRSGFPALAPTAFDIKTDSADDRVRAAKHTDYARTGAEGRNALGEALAAARIVFSLVTADQAHAAARAAATGLRPGALFLDGNSCSPGAKRRSAAAIQAAGGHYVDVAVMAPVHPGLHRTPLLVAGPHASEARDVLLSLGMVAETVDGDVGAASSIKMIRSIMVKGLEALVAECVLAGRKAGIDDIVLASLDKTFPGFGWPKRAAYMLERVMTHGVRRAAEMREVAVTVEELGLPAAMTRATVDWQQSIGALHLDATAIGEDHGARAEAILGALEATTRRSPEGGDR